jgi:hypothetical protein
LLAGCASQTPTRTGFLSDYDALARSERHPDTPSYRKPGSLTSYTAFILDDVSYHPEPDTAALDDRTVAELTDRYRAALLATFEQRYRHAQDPGPGVMRIRAAITGVASAQPVVNAITMAVAFVPVTAGGASTEAEIVDALTGERLVAYQGFNNGNQSFLGGPIGALSTYGQARRALDSQAEELASLMRED